MDDKQLSSRKLVYNTLINPVFLSSSYLTLLPLVISTTCARTKQFENEELEDINR
jgi:hypothetical protein